MYIYLDVGKRMIIVKMWLLYSSTWKRLTALKMSSGSFKNVVNKICLQVIYTVTHISIGYMLFSVITLVYVRHLAWYLVSNIW